MYRAKLFEPTGFILTAATFLFSMILFYNNTDVFLGSIIAALMAAGLFWISYIILRFVLLAFRN